MAATWALVVSHNRRALLRRCLEAIAAQTTPPDRVLVVDNASTDGTVEMLVADFPAVERLLLAENGGSAGGFREGLAWIQAQGVEWVWLMDDDTIPSPTALEALVAASTRLQPRPMLLAGYVAWTDGSPHPMNFPTLNRRSRELIVAALPQRAAPIRSCTYVSLLVHREALERHGLPLKHFFLWADDIEWTSRIILGGGGGYFVPESVAVHETAAAVDFSAGPPERFYFHVRNTLLIARAPGRPLRDRVLRTYIFATTIPPYLLRRRSWAAFVAIARGIRDGLMTSPTGA